jgi:Flp pilus assembly pilin Flp
VLTQAASAVRRLVKDESGQDLAEYALLGVFVALVTKVALDLVGTAVATAYVFWDTAEQNLWEPPSPPAP